MIRVLKPAVFIYECIRILFLAIFIFFQPGDSPNLPRLIYAAPGALFPLMALFIWLDISRYRAYLPLFIAGKCIGIFTLAVWLIISPGIAAWGIGSLSMISTGTAIRELLLMDILALSAVILIKKYDNQTEDTKCG